LLNQWAAIAHPGATRAMFLLWLNAFTVCSLLTPSHADSVDIEARLYRDADCFERAGEVMLLDGGCYANLYSNATKAYSVRITGFGDLAVQKFSLFEYVGTCTKGFQFNTPRKLKGGKCERFLGPYFANFRARQRSSVCVGEDCSTLTVALQQFYSLAECGGLATHTFKYPLKNACLRSGNGTQAYRVDASYKSITQIDYLGDDRCKGSLTKTYIMTNRRCYSLYANKEPRSFSWTVEEATPATRRGATGGSRHRRSPWLVLFAILPLVGV